METGRLLLTALGFALWTGLLEQIPIHAARSAGVFVRVSPDLIWMAPVADAMFFGLAALALLGLGRVWPRAASRPVVLGSLTGLLILALALLQERLHPLASLLIAVGVGTLVGRMTRPAPRRPRFLPVATATVALVIVALAARAKWDGHVERQRSLAALQEAPAGARSVLLIILDAVRGASLGFLAAPGGSSLWPPAVSPTLDAVVRASVLFEDAVAASPWTLPSHASMFTGQWPSRLSADWGRPLDREYPTVAEVMAGHGYLTVGVVGNLLYASRETGLDRGFLDYQDYPVSLGQALLSSAFGRRLLANRWLRRVAADEDLPNRFTAEEVTDAFLKWQGAIGGRPFFAFVNYFDAHEPYFPPDSLRSRIPPGTHWNDFTYYTGLLTGVHARRAEKWTMNRDEAAVHASAYNAAIHRADLEAGRLLDELDRRGVLENTIVILASDHGEQLGEHGLFEHQNSLYRTAIHVPLLVHDPQVPGRARRVSSTVSLRDIGATIVDLAGLDVPSSGLGGRSLARFWEEDGETEAESGYAPDTVFSALSPRHEGQAWLPVGQGPMMYSLSDSAYHYILNVDGSEELYAVKRDPGENDNLAKVSGFQGALEGFRAMMAGVLGKVPGVQGTTLGPGRRTGPGGGVP